MLRWLRIRNFAIIDELEMEFSDGFNAITGETGAGKSIILDAISLILGNRGNTDVVRSGSDEATVEAVFETTSGGEALKNKLSNFGISENENDGELLVRRLINKNGKSRAFLNGDLVTLGQLADICENLVDLCSQHEHQSLSKPAYQLDLIDRYGGLLPLVNQVRNSYLAIKSLETELANLQAPSGIATSSEDFIRFQIQEIEEFNPLEGEDEKLLTEKKRLQNLSQITDFSRAALEFLAADSGSSDAVGASELIAKARQRILKALELDQSLAPIAAAIERTMAELDEAASSLQDYLENLEADPTRLEWVEDRLAAWNMIKKKYGATAEEITATRERLSLELDSFSNRQGKIEALKAKFETVRDEYMKLALGLSKKRKAIAKTLTDSIQTELSELLMSNTNFSVGFEDYASNYLTETGIDRVQFLFSANAGEVAKPMRKIASGGELSRILLALRRTISDRGGIGVYLFDEIDSGIGGQTASVVGQKLRSVAKFNQVICITHLPQVAAFAKTHFVVSKKTVEGRTLSQIDRLRGSNRVEEIARMLGGLNVTEKSRANAKELINQAELT